MPEIKYFLITELILSVGLVPVILTELGRLVEMTAQNKRTDPVCGNGEILLTKLALVWGKRGHHFNRTSPICGNTLLY